MSRSPIIAVAWPKADYLSSLERAGATPRVVTPADAIDEVMTTIDGVLLTGGADVDPAHYGDAQRHDTLSLEPERDTYELELAKAAMAHDLPLLAICRGLQLLNVAAGGTLFQDLPSQSPSGVNHRVKEPHNHATHPVRLTPRTRLESLMTTPGVTDVYVNSRHHQAVRVLAPEFVVSAVAPDGVVEAIERLGANFCVGVQWHPENFWTTGEFNTLFDGFVESARARIR